MSDDDSAVIVVACFTDDATFSTLSCLILLLLLLPLFAADPSSTEDVTKPAVVVHIIVCALCHLHAFFCAPKNHESIYVDTYLQDEALSLLLYCYLLIILHKQVFPRTYGVPHRLVSHLTPGPHSFLYTVRHLNTPWDPTMPWQSTLNPNYSYLDHHSALLV